MPRSINDIVPPSRRRPMSDMEMPAPDMDTAAPPPSRPPVYSRPRRRFPWGTAIVALIVVAGCVGALYAFSGAKVVIEPMTLSGAVAGTFTATPNTGTLPYVLVNVQKVATKSVPAESTVTASDTAQGSITIYNEQPKPQQLIKNTRFETPTGLIFRIHDPITVPAGSATAPGSVTATVYADSPGETYNIGPATFTLPGLEGSDAFDQVSAKSTASMAGGFSGTRPAVSQGTADAGHAELRATLEAEIGSEVAANVPEGYTLIPGGIFVTYAPLPETADGSGGVLVRSQANAVAVVFPSEAIAAAVANSIGGSQYNSGQPVMLANPEDLRLSTGTETPTGAEDLTFELSGNASIVWKVDTAKIAGAVAGKSRAAAEPILTGYPEIARASLTLRPFWRNSFPDDPSEIEVSVEASGTAN